MQKQAKDLCSVRVLDGKKVFVQDGGKKNLPKIKKNFPKSVSSRFFIVSVTPKEGRWTYYPRKWQISLPIFFSVTWLKWSFWSRGSKPVYIIILIYLIRTPLEARNSKTKLEEKEFQVQEAKANLHAKYCICTTVLSAGQKFRTFKSEFFCNPPEGER